MKSANLKAALPLFVCLVVFSMSAHAAIDNAGVFDSVLNRYSTAAAAWAGVITAAASWLFWTLVTISMVWTFGMLALRKADIGEFFAEFLKFIVFTGFFWWLLTNGPAFASSIYDSLRQLAGNATGLGGALSPSSIVDIGFAIFDRVIDGSALWSPVDSTAGILIALAILIILALVGVNMLLLLASGWVLAYGGVFFLGFGGSRWTSDMAINYYKTVLGIAAQLMTMVLLVGIGKTFLDDYYSRMSAGISLKEMGVMLIVAIILLALVNKIPTLLAGIITGASVGGAGIGAMGAGAALGAAGMAAAASAVGGAMVASGAASAAVGAQAVMAAVSKAAENVSSGSDVLSSFGGGGSDGGGSSGTGDTPFAQAAGFSSSSSGTGPGWAGGGDSGGGFMAPAAKAGRIAADAGDNLAKGVATVASAKASITKGAAMERIAETTGGKVAAAIKAQGTSEQTFDDDSLTSAADTQADPDSEIAAFENRDSKTA